MRFVIGDVHGSFYTLQKLIEKIKEQDKSPKLIFVGDYADRGLNSKQTIEYLIGLKSSGAFFVRGNHDDVVDYIWNGESLDHPSEWVRNPPTLTKIITWWFQHGFIETCQSYGFETKTSYVGQPLVNGLDVDTFVFQMRKKIPKSHKEFLRYLPMYYEDDDIFVMHGYLNPNMMLPRNFKFLRFDVSASLWGRFGLIKAEGFATQWDKIGVFGHTPVMCYGEQEPIKADKIRLIDLAGFKGNGLVAYCVENDDFIWAESDPKDISQEWVK